MKQRPRIYYSAEQKNLMWDRWQAGDSTYEIARLFDRGHSSVQGVLASKANAIPEEVWQRWSSAVAWWLTFPGAQTWWKVRPIPFTDSFTSYVESLLENNPTDAETTRRYQDFVAQGKHQT